MQVVSSMGSDTEAITVFSSLRRNSHCTILLRSAGTVFVYPAAPRCQNVANNVCEGRGGGAAAARWADPLRAAGLSPARPARSSAGTAMNSNKCLPELVAEKNTLDPSFVHALRLLAE
ncbi:unnamed protein product, partial [Pleuronectes platessa]